MRAGPLLAASASLLLAAAPGLARPPSTGRIVPAVREADWAAALFDQFDQNGDGVLNSDEMPEALRAERDKWDADGNGLIDLAEFRAFLRAGGRQLLADRPAPADRGPPAPAAPDADPGRPVVYRSGNLPRELPGWFREVDADGDAQVGLYEWRAAGRPVDEFLKMDLNGDGFLTVDEVLRYQRQAGGAAAASGNVGRPRANKG
jgi:hypothetical protein